VTIEGCVDENNEANHLVIFLFMSFEDITIVSIAHVVFG
jgi:hypothetical protein